MLGKRISAKGLLIRLALCLGVSVATSVSVLSAQEPELWPGAKYDPAIPTLKQVVGHDPGTAITTPEQIAQYLQALQKAAPARTRLIEYTPAHGRAGRSGCS